MVCVPVELVEAARAIEERIAYYASLKADDAPNIEDWAYTDGSGDIARLRAALAHTPQPVQGEADGYTSYGEFRWACDADERMRATWTPLWTAQPPAVGCKACEIFHNRNRK